MSEPRKEYSYGNGYVYVRWPDYPMADTRGVVAKHRLVIAERLGRMLGSNEVVHHVNLDRSDNRPENLELYERGEHSSLHIRRYQKVNPPKACLTCGEMFHSKYPKAKYCNRECYELSRPKLGPPKVCPTCGREFQMGRPVAQRRAKYCSMKCMLLRLHPPEHKPKRCAMCGKEYFGAGRTNHAQSRFCSRACYYAFSREDMPPKPCAYCGKLFVSRHGSHHHKKQKYCSRKCAGKGYTRRPRK